MKATSTYLNLPRRDLQDVRGEPVRHMPEAPPAFLLGPDEVCVSSAVHKTRWRKKAIVWSVALGFLVLGFTVGPHAVLYLQAVMGE